MAKVTWIGQSQAGSTERRGDVCVLDHRHTIRWVRKQNSSSQTHERTAGMGES